jgi:probable O-glycosylation ligase (exosortase A-associated)
MKQVLFMAVVTFFGCFGSFAITPFVGLAVYILYAVLRPQFMWQWSLPEGVQWSLFVALATIFATLVRGLAPPPPVPGRWPPAPMKFTAAHVLFFLFGGWLVISYAQALVPSAGDAHMVDYGKMYIMVAVGVLVVRTVRHVWVLVLIYGLSTAYIAYEVNFLYFVNGYLGIVRNGYGGHDSNGAGLLLALGLPMCVCAWELYRGWYRWVFAAFVPVIVHAVLMTYSRGAMLSLIVAAPLWVFRGRGRERKLKLALAVAVLAMVPFMAGQQIQERFFSIAAYKEDDSAQSRFTSWRIGLEIAAEFPVFGCGVRNSPLLTYSRGADIEGRAIHSQYIQIAADNGFFGLFLYCAIALLALRDTQAVIRAARGRDDPDSRRAYLAAVGIQSALGTFLFGAIFLSCEAFEPQYYLFLAATQLRLAYLSSPCPVPEVPRPVVPPLPPLPPLQPARSAG